MDSSPFYCNTWLRILGVILVNGAVGLIFHIVRKIAPGMPRNGFKGFYFVLVPLGFLAIWTWNDPMIWFTYGCAVIGLLLIARCWPRIA